MALKIKLQRAGASRNPIYRLVVAEGRGRRDGRFVEKLGTYAPRAKSEEQMVFQLERVRHWESVGAKPTDTAAALIKKARRAQPESAPAEEAPSETASAEEAET